MLESSSGVPTFFAARSIVKLFHLFSRVVYTSRSVLLIQLLTNFFFLWLQARAYARAMKATLFFSSATHNINVNKIFKFITAKLFNLPWTVERNLTIGEPIIDF
jgi:hypothetical protein